MSALIVGGDGVVATAVAGGLNAMLAVVGLENLIVSKSMSLSTLVSIASSLAALASRASSRRCARFPHLRRYLVAFGSVGASAGRANEIRPLPLKIVVVGGFCSSTWQGGGVGGESFL